MLFWSSLLQVPHTIAYKDTGCCPKINTLKTIVSGGRGMNTVTTTISNLQLETGLIVNRTSDLVFSSLVRSMCFLSWSPNVDGYSKITT